MTAFYSDSLIASKSTTQRAPLEKLLTHLRTRKVLAYTQDAVVLDFGCGAHLKTLRTIGNRANARYGIDSVFKGRDAFTTPDQISVSGAFSQLSQMLKEHKRTINRIVSLACFEHLEAQELKSVLRELHKVSSDDAVLIGTVPTPPAKPVLEFLSYKLRLIDPTQIEDHKVYYNRRTLENALLGTGWTMQKYRTFQIGMNSFFVFHKV